MRQVDMKRILNMALADFERVLIEARNDQKNRVELLDIFNSGITVNLGKLKIRAIDAVLDIMHGDSKRNRKQQERGHAGH